MLANNKAKKNQKNPFSGEGGGVSKNLQTQPLGWRGGASRSRGGLRLPPARFQRIWALRCAQAIQKQYKFSNFAKKFPGAPFFFEAARYTKMPPRAPLRILRAKLYKNLYKNIYNFIFRIFSCRMALFQNFFAHFSYEKQLLSQS